MKPSQYAMVLDMLFAIQADVTKTEVVYIASGVIAMVLFGASLVHSTRGN